MQINKCNSSKSTKKSSSSSIGDDGGDCSGGDLGLPRLSDELVEKVVALLPNVADVARCGLLSKAWYSIVHSPSFWQLRSNSSTTVVGSCLLLQPNKSLPPANKASPWAAYLPNAQRWTSSVCACLNRDSYVKMMSSRGLICAMEPDRTVVVFNPLTNSCSTLPCHELLFPPERPDGCCTYFTLSFGVDPVTLSYIVLFFFYCFDDASCFPVLYDSSTKTWSRGKTVPLPDADMIPPAPVPALRGTSFFFLAQEGTSLVRYHVCTDCWSTIKLRPPAGLVVPPCPGRRPRLKTPCGKSLLVDPSLIESLGRLLLVGGYEAAANGLQQTLCIWELKEEEAASTQELLPWKAVELTRMPQELWLDFISMQPRRGLRATPAGAGDVICFYSLTDHRILPYVCNLFTNSWHKVPAFPGFSTEPRYPQNVVVFEPRLDSVA